MRVVFNFYTKLKVNEFVVVVVRHTRGGSRDVD